VKLLALLYEGARSGRLGGDGGEGGKSGGEGKAGRVRVMLEIERIMAGVEMGAGVGAGDGGDGEMS
jgi:hypothetical protein